MEHRDTPALVLQPQSLQEFEEVFLSDSVVEDLPVGNAQIEIDADDGSPEHRVGLLLLDLCVEMHPCPVKLFVSFPGPIYLVAVQQQSASSGRLIELLDDLRLRGGIPLLAE